VPRDGLIGGFPSIGCSYTLDRATVYASTKRCRATSSTSTRLSAAAINDIVGNAALRAELPDADAYTAHSLRAGGATSAYRAGAPVSSIARHGRWAPNSPVVLGYIRSVDRWRETRCGRSGCDPDGRPVSAIELAVRLTFVPAGQVVLDESGRPRFPALPTQPAVYRLTFTGVGPDRVYIGETDNTRRRGQNYRTPGPSQRTSLRINALLRDHLAAGGTAALASRAPPR
jgi:hypothetical protein